MTGMRWAAMRAANRLRRLRSSMRRRFRPTSDDREQAQRWEEAQHAADRAITTALEKQGGTSPGFLYAADVQRAGRDLGFDVAEHDAHAGLYHRLVARGFKPGAVTPVWDYHSPTPIAKADGPCDRYDAGIPDFPWCRRCGWVPTDHT